MVHIFCIKYHRVICTLFEICSLCSYLYKAMTAKTFFNKPMALYRHLHPNHTDGKRKKKKLWKYFSRYAMIPPTLSAVVNKAVYVSAALKCKPRCYDTQVPRLNIKNHSLANIPFALHHILLQYTHKTYSSRITISYRYIFQHMHWSHLGRGGKALCL